MAVPTGLLQYALNVGLNRELRVIADPDNRLGHHVGNGIWTSAHEQALFIGNRKHLTRNRSVLELGSGLGLVGQAAILGGATVVLSDLPEMLPLLELNVKANEAVLAQSSDCLQARCMLSVCCIGALS